MAKSLVVVESPAKAKTIRKYLDSSFEVEASVGHLIDLPPNRMGVDLESGEFTPEYVPISGKEKIVELLRKAGQRVDKVYLAPDPDREGEAIAFHIANVINGSYSKNSRTKAKAPEIVRVRFHEITKKAILDAIKHPVALDEHLFDAQQARRVLDRVVGYQISPLLWKKVRRGLSAGRVQSVAVRIVVDRENEISAFKTKEYWSIEALVDAQAKPKFTAKLIKSHDKKAEISNGEQAQALVDELKKANPTIANVAKKSRHRKAGPPFITSKLQQDAARAFRFTAKRTMALAQSLYEGIELGEEEGAVGLITYMRTDSTRVSNEALDMVREFIRDAFGKDYLPEAPNFFKSKKGAQEAHEAIRPTSMKYTPEYVKPFLKADQFKLYRLIWERFVASQMTQAEFDQLQIDIEAGENILRATGSTLKFDGFLRVYHEQVDEDDKSASDEAKEESTKLPQVSIGQSVQFETVTPTQHFTEPPPRFSEASLVKELEDRGIGRPSTYASIMSVIQDKGYVDKKEGRFYPSELGAIVTSLLMESFPSVMDIDFTAAMENKLDKIEEGEENWKTTLHDFYEPFKETISHAKESMRDIKRMEEITDIMCEKCGKPFVIKWGKNGSFLGCSGYPDCSNTKAFTRVDGKIVIEQAKEIDVKCKTCGAPMLLKRGKFGEFLGCSRYPECSFTSPLPTNVKCPKDGGDVVSKRSQRAKVFYGCSNYPSCDFVSWNKPVNRACPACQNPYVVEKITRQGGHLECPACKNKIEMSDG